MDEKAAYEKKLRSQLDEWSLEIDKLKAKAEQAEADARLRYYDEIEKIRDQQERMQEKLDAIESAGEEAWRDLKAGAESAWQELNSAVRSAMERFK